jgi:autotransporter-associated beta strand protein
MKVNPKFRCREAVLVAAAAFGLSACGGGGSNVQPTPAAPAPAPAPAPPQPPIDAQLATTNTYAAHAQGYTGAGVIIGVVDSGIMRIHPALAGRVNSELIYVDPATNNTAIDDVVGHGTWVSEIAAGTSFGQFAGGIAPGAQLVSARIISDVAPTSTSSQGSLVTSADPLGQINADLINNGVKVMNNSWGGLYWPASATATTQSFHDAYNNFINTWGGLVVFAAGNSSDANPSDTAALPSRAPDLEKGWLTVVAVDSNNPTQLASYSNACGVAMNYCLAAPGDVIVSGKDDTATSQTYWIVKGTSMAAPQVSGAAALVWQAYPYFTNDLVRQTLLGTATPLGGSQPNATFGYGELNVGKAVNGPAQFNWGDVTVNFAGNSNWNNPISGAGGLIKQGAGTLTLTQPSSFTGLTQVQGGTLIAQSLASSVNIAAGGTLSGTQAIAGSITNAGVLGVSGSNVTVAGNYTQQGAGRLAVSLGSALQVTGTASLNGGDLYVIGSNSGYVVSAHTDVLTATGGLTGTFSALNMAPNVTLTATLGYDANSAWLNVQQLQVTALAMSYTAASFGAAQRVQGAFGLINTQLTVPTSTTTPVSSGFIAGAASFQQSPTLATVQSSLQSLSGQLHAASAAMTFESIDAGTRALSDRFDNLVDAPRVGGWAQDLGYHGGLSRSGYNNVGFDLNGWMVGEDHRVGGDGVVGYALSQSQGLGRLTGTADQDFSHAVEGMMYGGVIRGQWYTMGRFGVGSYRENMRRFLQLGNQFSAVASESRGRYGVAYGESGYRTALGGTRITPYMNLQYAQIQRDGFNELGAYGFGLKSGAQTTARWQAGLGLRASRDWMLPRWGRLSLQTRLLWQQSFGLRGDVFQASFSGINQFAPVGGIGLSRYGGIVGTALNWGMTPRASLLLGYDQYFGQRQQAGMASARFNWSF